MGLSNEIVLCNAMLHVLLASDSTPSCNAHSFHPARDTRCQWATSSTPLSHRRVIVREPLSSVQWSPIAIGLSPDSTVGQCCKRNVYPMAMLPSNEHGRSSTVAQRVNGPRVKKRVGGTLASTTSPAKPPNLSVLNLALYPLFLSPLSFTIFRLPTRVFCHLPQSSQGRDYTSGE